MLIQIYQFTVNIFTRPKIMKHGIIYITNLKNSSNSRCGTWDLFIQTELVIAIHTGKTVKSDRRNDRNWLILGLKDTWHYEKNWETTHIFVNLLFSFWSEWKCQIESHKKAKFSKIGFIWYNLFIIYNKNKIVGSHMKSTRLYLLALAILKIFSLFQTPRTSKCWAVTYIQKITFLLSKLPWNLQK